MCVFISAKPRAIISFCWFLNTRPETAICLTPHGNVSQLSNAIYHHIKWTSDAGANVPSANAAAVTRSPVGDFRTRNLVSISRGVTMELFQWLDFCPIPYIESTSHKLEMSCFNNSDPWFIWLFQKSSYSYCLQLVLQTCARPQAFPNTHSALLSVKK